MDELAQIKEMIETFIVLHKKAGDPMQAEYLKRRFEIKDDLHRLISGIELSRSLKTEEKEVKDGVNQLEVKGYDKQTVNIEYNVSGQWGTAPYIEYMEWRRLKGKKGPFLLGSEQLGSGDFLLKSVELADAKPVNNGVVALASIKLELVLDDVLEATENGTNKAGSEKQVKRSERETTWKEMYGSKGVAKSSTASAGPSEATKKALLEG